MVDVWAKLVVEHRSKKGATENDNRRNRYISRQGNKFPYSSTQSNLCF